MTNTPFVVDTLLSPTLFSKIQLVTKGFRASPPSFLSVDELFSRKYCKNYPLFQVLHHNLTSVASEMFGEKLKPSYSYLSMYSDNGICPLHTDRPQCYRTIDLCINQKEVWPLYVNFLKKYDKVPFYPHQESTPLGDEIKVTSNRYDLQPGQALCYSGTDSPHWRNRIAAGNFCDLVFFHFVPEDFEGNLD